LGFPRFAMARKKLVSPLVLCAGRGGQALNQAHREGLNTVLQHLDEILWHFCWDPLELNQIFGAPGRSAKSGGSPQKLRQGQTKQRSPGNFGKVLTPWLTFLEPLGSKHPPLSGTLLTMRPRAAGELWNTLGLPCDIKRTALTVIQNLFCKVCSRRTVAQLPVARIRRSPSVARASAASRRGGQAKTRPCTSQRLQVCPTPEQNDTRRSPPGGHVRNNDTCHMTSHRLHQFKILNFGHPENHQITLALGSGQLQPYQKLTRQHRFKHFFSQVWRGFAPQLPSDGVHVICARVDVALGFPPEDESKAPRRLQRSDSEKN
jgi:hypothetical protein